MDRYSSRDIIEDWIALSVIADLETETSDALYDFPRKQMEETLPIVRSIMLQADNQDDPFIEDDFFRDRLEEAKHMLNLARASHFVLAFAYFENGMITFARNCLSSSDTRWSWSDINGRGIEKCKTIIQKTHDASGVFSSPEWEKILAYQELRNLIVHSAGIGSEIYGKYKRLSGLNDVEKELIDSEEKIFRVSLGEHFVRDSTKCFQAFLDIIVPLQKRGKTCS